MQAQCEQKNFLCPNIDRTAFFHIGLALQTTFGYNGGKLGELPDTYFLTERLKMDIAKVAKLKEKAEQMLADAKASNNEYGEKEALNFLDKALEMMEKLNLTEEDITLEMRRKGYVRHIFDFENIKGITPGKKYSPWRAKIVWAIAKHLKCLAHGRHKSTEVVVYGPKHEVEFVEYLTLTLVRECMKLCDDQYRKLYQYYKFIGETDRIKGFRRSFCEAFSDKIHERLKVTQQNLDYAKSNEIIKLSNDVQDWASQTYGLRFGASKSYSYTRNSAGFSAGSNAGNSANLNRPLTRNKTKYLT